jgi:hypothetical protein
MPPPLAYGRHAPIPHTWVPTLPLRTHEAMPHGEASVDVPCGNFGWMFPLGTLAESEIDRRV